MNYIPDPDLDFLRYCSQPQLDVLVNYLTVNTKGKARRGQMLTKSARYQEHAPNHPKYWNLIAAEIQFAGGHKLANYLTGEGALYRTTLDKVCKKMKVKAAPAVSTEEVEMLFVLEIFQRSLDKMSAEELKELLASLEIEPKEFSKQALVMAAQTAIKAGKVKPQLIAGFLSSALAKVMLKKTAAAALLKGLKYGLKKATVKFLGLLTGPVGFAATATWILNDLAGPSYKIIVPIVVQIAYMRAEHQGKLLPEDASTLP